jgi:glycosyltransferase involved in cell wall biosynthesis
MDSVVKQTLKEIEIICVDDGSTDQSLAILKEYQKKDDRIVVIEKENGGYGQAMNVGMAHACGKYIGIVEPDDYVALDMYEELYETAIFYDLDFVKADFYRFKRDKTGGMTFAYNRLSPKKEDYRVVFCPSTDPETLRYTMNTWSGIYKRHFLKQYNIRHNETPGASFQDNGFWFQTFIYGKRAMILDRPYYRNRRDNPNSSVHSREKVYCMNIEYDHIRAILMKDPVIWERFRYLYWFKKYHNYMATLQRIGDEYKHEYVMRFSEELKRGNALGELKEEVFSPMAWSHIMSLINDPENYYRMRVYPVSMNQKVFKRMDQLENQNRKLQNEIKRVRTSNSFRLGRTLLYVPGKLKKRYKNRRKRDGKL